MDQIDASQVTWDHPETPPTATLAQAAPQVPPVIPSQIPSQALSDDLINQVKWDQDVYGTVPQQALGLAEQFAKGFAGPVATGAEEALARVGVPGISAEERLAREEQTGIPGKVAEALGVGASLATGVGEAALLAKGSQAAAQAFKLGTNTSRISQAGALAFRGALEGLGFDAGDELSNWINQKPGETVANAVANLGLSAVLGGAVGGLFGGAFPKFFAEKELLINQGLQDFKNAATGSVVDQAAMKPVEELQKSGIWNEVKQAFDFKKLKSSAPELAEIGEKHQWPIYEGMISDNKVIQAQTDALLNGPPTIAGLTVQREYQQAFDKVAESVNQVTKAPAAMTETQVGDALKESLINQLEKKYQPIKQLYETLEPYKPITTIPEKEINSLKSYFKKVVKDQGLIPNTERFNFVKTFENGLDNIKNLQQLSNFKTEIGRSSGPLTKDLSRTLSQEIERAEEVSFKTLAKTLEPGLAKQEIEGLLKTAETAKKEYSSFREQLQTLGNSLGKKKIYGPQNFLDFIEDLNPQLLIKRAFSERNTTFGKYLWTHFPEQMDLIVQYQRGLLREEATKEGVVNTNKLLSSIKKLPFEYQKILYTNAERETIDDAFKYIQSFPKSFNPSGTSHMIALREYHEKPDGMILSNLRDAAMLSFIKSMDIAVPGSKKYAPQVLAAVGPKVASGEINAKSFMTAVKTVISAIKSKEAIDYYSKALFHGTMKEVPKLSHEELDRLENNLDRIKKNPTSLLDQEHDLYHYMPNHSTVMTQSALNAAQTLAQVKPFNPKLSILDKELPLTPGQKNQYYRALQIAEKPLTVMNHIKNGTLLPQDVLVLQKTHPEYFKTLSNQIMHDMTDHLEKQGTIPYPTRQSLSLLLGTPLDSTLSPVNMQQIQNTFVSLPNQQQGQQAQQPKIKHGTAILSKMPQTLMTQQQNLQRRMNK